MQVIFLERVLLALSGAGVTVYAKMRGPGWGRMAADHRPWLACESRLKLVAFCGKTYNCKVESRERRAGTLVGIIGGANPSPSPSVQGRGRERMSRDEDERLPEIALVGDLTEHESELTDRLLDVEAGGECLIYFDSPGGSPYCAMSLMTLIRLRGLRATGIVTGECSSAALWPFAACQRRIVTPCSVMLFHPMRWQSEENVGLAEAAEWARHFGALEKDMDALLADLFGTSRELMDKWINPGKYVSGPELAAAGMAELVTFDRLGELGQLLAPSRNGQPLRATKVKARA
jgi:ATP-dependent Clp protease protease subunit